MIVKNEEEVLEQCLSSVKEACDEIIIVDTGSEDRTKEIAQSFTDKVFDFEWIDDFSAARQYAFDQATSEYILWLDADDMLNDEDKVKLISLKQSLSSEVDAVSMLYHIAYDAAGQPSFSYRRNRLVKRSKGFKWIGPVHEYLEVSGTIIASDIAVRHKKFMKKKRQVSGSRNLDIYEKRLAKGESFSPRDLFYYANELKDNAKYHKAIMYYREFLATKKGWVEDEIRACLNMYECYRGLDNAEKSMEALVMSMNYDVPRPEVSCKIGDIYKNKGQHKKAALWYRLALEVEVNDSQGFVQRQYSTWYPHLQLVVCCWELGEQEQAMAHNQAAGEYLPESPQVKHNEAFFTEYFKSKAT